MVMVNGATLACVFLSSSGDKSQQLSARIIIIRASQFPSVQNLVSLLL